MLDKMEKLSTEPYKGVRDFFPEDMAIEKKIFGIWRNIVEKYGYEEYGASVLEPAELYSAKTGEEIVNEQTYTFTDRGDRRVTLRPEMTPTLARMIAARKRELVFPLRWYSIPNLFRYEQPQRGRVREHWQLNVDIFGVDSTTAEVEVLNIAYDITRAYGLKDTDFEIRLNNRKLMDYITRDIFSLGEETAQKLSKLIDKKQKISKEAFDMGVQELFAKENKTDKVTEFLTLLNSQNFEEFTAHLPQTKEEHVGLKEIREVIKGLEQLGVTNVRFDQTLMRGFDYLTGIVFEIFDKNPLNRRSIFGGGRYDDLLSLFGNEKVSGFGFGAGDVIARDVMETYGTLKELENEKQPPVDLSICIIGEQNTPFALDLAQKLREKCRVSVNLSNKKLGDQIANASKRKIPKIICIGNDEVKTGKMIIKDMANGKEAEATESTLLDLINS